MYIYEYFSGIPHFPEYVHPYMHINCAYKCKYKYMKKNLPVDYLFCKLIFHNLAI